MSYTDTKDSPPRLDTSTYVHWIGSEYGEYGSRRHPLTNRSFLLSPALLGYGMGYPDVRTQRVSARQTET